jgi:hypothetical protein
MITNILCVTQVVTLWLGLWNVPRLAIASAWICLPTCILSYFRPCCSRLLAATSAARLLFLLPKWTGSLVLSVLYYLWTILSLSLVVILALFELTRSCQWFSSSLFTSVILFWLLFVLFLFFRRHVSLFYLSCLSIFCNFIFIYSC